VSLMGQEPKLSLPEDPLGGVARARCMVLLHGSADFYLVLDFSRVLFTALCRAEEIQESNGLSLGTLEEARFGVHSGPRTFSSLEIVGEVRCLLRNSIREASS
jgi:hypothetical protein